MPAINEGYLFKDQVEYYQTEGYLLIDKLLDEADLIPAQYAMSDKVQEIAEELLSAGLITESYEDAPFEIRLAKLFEGKTDADFLKYGRSWRERRAGYFILMSNPKILDVVDSLIGAEIFSNPVYNTRPKVPHVAAGAVPWHQDKSYWPDANSNPVITVWIPFVDANEVNGCLHIWPRTHRTRVLTYHNETYSGTGYTEIDDAELAEIRKRVQPVCIPVKRGGAILFNDRCIHMSTPNRSDHVRWSVDLRYQPVDQDPMSNIGVGFLARSKSNPSAVATLEDWLAYRPEHM